MNRSKIFSERERFSGKNAEIIEAALAETEIGGRRLLRGGLILIAAAAHLSGPIRDWRLERERIEMRKFGMVKSSVPEISSLEICAMASPLVQRCQRPKNHFGECADFPERGDFGPMNETCRHCHTTRPQSGAHCIVCRVMLGLWGC